MLSGILNLISTMLIAAILSFPQPYNQPQFTEGNNNLGFVVYTKDVFYGVNAGSINQELRFRFSQQNKQNVLFIDISEDNQFFTVAAYNNKGLFILIQDHPASLKKNRITPTEFERRFNKILFESSNTPDINSGNLSTNELIVPNSNQLFADKFGNTIIIHSDDEKSHVIQNDLPYFSLTYLYPYIEFQNSLIVDGKESLHSQLMAEIDKSDENFSVEIGMNVLTEFQPMYDTLTSIIVSPNGNQVFVSLDKNAEEIWMFDINGGTVETYAGFDKSHKANIPKLGITTSDLKILNFSNEDLTLGIISIAGLILLIIIIPSLFLILKLSKNVDLENQNQ